VAQPQPQPRPRLRGWLVAAAIALLVPAVLLQLRPPDLAGPGIMVGVDPVPRASVIVVGDATQTATADPSPTGSFDPVTSPGPDPTALATPAPLPTSTPAPTTAPGTPGMYGSAIGMDSLNNTQVGGPNNTSTSYRFRASTSARLNSIRVYIIGPTHAGYGAGTGGTWQVSVQTDNGASNHAPSGTVLATTTFKPVDNFPVISWSAPASLSAGILYHIVFVNVDADPTVNYASVDGVFMFRPTSQRQPAFSNVNWGQPTRSGSGGWSDLSTTVPIMQLNYSNGVTAGLGYMEVWVRSYKAISGTARAREAFTVSGSNRSVSSFSVRLMRISGSSPLTVRLETSDGTLIEQGTISASAIAIGTYATWVTCTFPSSQTLVAGQAYNVVLSTTSDTVYSIFVIRKGSSWGFSPTTYFSYGHAQYTTGSSWGPFTQDGGSALDQGDLQFYFD